MEFDPYSHSLDAILGSPDVLQMPAGSELHAFVDLAGTLLSIWGEDAWGHLLAVRDLAEDKAREMGDKEDLNINNLIALVDELMMGSAMGRDPAATNALFERTFIHQSIGSMKRAKSIYDKLPKIAVDNPDFVHELKRFFSECYDTGCRYDFRHAIQTYIDFNPENGHSRVEHEEIGSIPYALAIASRLFDEDGDTTGDSGRIGLTLVMRADASYPWMTEAINVYLKELIERREDPHHIDAIKRWFLTGVFPGEIVGIKNENDWHGTCAVLPGLLMKNKSYDIFAKFIQGAEAVRISDDESYPPSCFDLDAYIVDRYWTPSQSLPEDPKEYEYRNFVSLVKGMFRRGYIPELITLVAKGERFFQENIDRVSNSAYDKLSIIYKGAIRHFLSDPEAQALIIPYVLSGHEEDAFLAFDTLWAADSGMHPILYEAIRYEDLPAIDLRLSMSWLEGNPDRYYRDVYYSRLLVFTLAKHGWEGRFPFWERVLNSYMDQPGLYEQFVEIFRYALELAFVGAAPNTNYEDWQVNNAIEDGDLTYLMGDVDGDVAAQVDDFIRMREIWEGIDFGSLEGGNEQIYGMVAYAINDTIPALFEKDVARSDGNGIQYILNPTVNTCEKPGSYGERCVEVLGKPMLDILRTQAIEGGDRGGTRQCSLAISKFMIEPMAADAVEVLIEITENTPSSAAVSLDELCTIDARGKFGVPSLADGSELRNLISEFLEKFDFSTVIDAIDDDRWMWIVIANALIEHGNPTVMPAIEELLRYSDISESTRYLFSDL
jgi:hypothetical protein